MGPQGREFDHEFADRRKITDESYPGGQGDGQPHGMLGALAPGLIEAHRLAVELDTAIARAFQAVLHPDIEIGPDALRTRIAAPDAAGKDGDEEQSEGADDQQPGEQNELLGIEGGGKDMKLTPRQVEPDHRPIAPGEPGQGEEGQHQGPVRNTPHPLKQSLDFTHVDVLPLGIHLLLDGARRRWLNRRFRGHVLRWDFLAHVGLAAGLRGPQKEGNEEASLYRAP